MKPSVVIAILALPVFGVALYISLSGGPGGPPGLGGPALSDADPEAGMDLRGPDGARLQDPESLAMPGTVRSLLPAGEDAADVPPDELLQSAIQIQVVSEQSGEFLAGVHLELRSGTGSDLDLPVPFRDFIAEGDSDSKGNHAFRVPPMGVYTVLATKEGFSSRELGPILPGDQVTMELRQGHVIAGVVYDIETDGPIAEASVRLFSPAGELVVETEKDGTFEIPDLAEGLYSAEALADGYDVDTTAGIQVGVGETLPLDIGLRPGATLSGSVRDGQTGDAIGGAEVTVVAERGPRDDARTLIELVTTTSSTGVFELTGVSRRDVYLIVHRDGYAKFRRKIRISEEEDDREENVTLYPGVQVAGVLVDPLGAPVANGKIRMGGVLSTDVATRTVDTASDGSFFFEEVRPNLKFSLVGVGPSETHAPGIAHDLVAHLGSPLTNLQIQLSLAGVVSGTVIDQRGENIPHARIVIEGISDVVWRAMGTGPIQYADSVGEFEFSGLPERSLTLTANLGEIISQPRVVQVVAGGLTADIRLRLVEGEEITGTVVDPSGKGIDDVLVTAFAQDDALSISSGPGGASKRDQALIKKSAGREGAGDRILQSVTGGKANTTAFRSLARTSEDGSFTLLGLDAATKLAVVLEHEEYAPVHEFNVAVTGQPLQLKMLPMLAITGRVIDKRSRKPIPYFFVTAKPLRESGTPKSLTQALSQKIGKSSIFQTVDGSFKLGGLQPGQYNVTVRADGYRDIPPTRVNLGASTNPIRIELPLSSVITGRVVGPNGGAIERVPVFVRSAPGAGPKGMKPRTGTTNAAGEFRFKDVVPGTLMIGAGKPTSPLGDPALIQLPEGDELNHDIRVDATAGLTVKVRNPSGFTVPGATVTVRGTQSGMNVRRKTDVNGNAEFPLLIAEKCNVVATLSPHKPATGQVNLSANDHPTKELELKEKK